MHPITAIEITSSVVMIIFLFTIALLVPIRTRKISLFFVLSLTLILIVIFVFRPYWIDYKVSVKTEHLNLYLEQKYPNQEWIIHRKEERQYNPYSLDVTFENEKQWTYTYLVSDTKGISQIGYSVPNGENPDSGQHHEPVSEPSFSK